MFQGFSPGNLNYLIMSLKIISSSALIILLFMWRLWFWNLLCVLFVLFSIRFGLEKYWSGDTVLTRRKHWKLVFEKAEVH